MNKNKVGTPNSHQQKDNIFQILSYLPDNRPIRNLQIVENYENVPANYHIILKTHDQDSDADLWRESSIIFGKKTSRYLCISKNEGFDNHVLSELKVIGEKENVPSGFTHMNRTIDTDQKAWRKRNQIIYKLSKKDSITHAITDIILCSKLRRPPEGFKLAGEIEKILICYKITELSETNSNIIDFTQQIESLKLHSGQMKKEEEHYYEQLRLSYQISPTRPAPSPPNRASFPPQRAAPSIPIPPPTNGDNSNNCQKQQASDIYKTMSHYTDVEGVPFILNPSISFNSHELNIPTDFNSCSESLEYDFILERQTLIQTKSCSSTNPFFH